MIRCDLAIALGTGLDLDGRVLHPRALAQELLDVVEHLAAPAFHPGTNVDARRVRAGRQRPEVEVVRLLDARNGEDLLAQSGKVDLARGALEEDVRRLAQEAD